MKRDERLPIFDHWIAEHKNLLIKVVRAYAFTSMDREDLFQEIVVQVWNSIPYFRGEAAVTTWLYRIALNTAIKWIKNERKVPMQERLDAGTSILQIEPSSVDDRIEWLYHEIRQLDEIDRSISLLLLEGLSYKEIAVITGLTESNVGVKINRVKKRLITKSKNIK